MIPSPVCQPWHPDDPAKSLPEVHERSAPLLHHTAGHDLAEAFAAQRATRDVSNDSPIRAIVVFRPNGMLTEGLYWRRTTCSARRQPSKERAMDNPIHGG